MDKTKNSTVFLTVEEVADRLRVSRAYVYGLVKQNEIPHHRLGDIPGRSRGTIRISEQQLADYLNGCYAGPVRIAPTRKEAKPTLRHLKL